MSLLPLLTLQFAPGDGTNYRAVLALLDANESEKNHVGSQGVGVFYAFGVGNLPVTGYFFDRTRPDFGYFYEKMRGCDPDHVATVYMAWLTLLILWDHPLPDQLPEYSDTESPPHRWYAGLKPGWVDDVRRQANLI